MTLTLIEHMGKIILRREAISQMIYKPDDEKTGPTLLFLEWGGSLYVEESPLHIQEAALREQADA